MTTDYSARNNEMLVAVQSGETYQVVADRYGITGERVRQIVTKRGYKPGRALEDPIAVLKAIRDPATRYIAHVTKPLGLMTYQVERCIEELGLRVAVTRLFKWRIAVHQRVMRQKQLEYSRQYMRARWQTEAGKEYARQYEAANRECLREYRRNWTRRRRLAARQATA